MNKKNQNKMFFFETTIFKRSTESFVEKSSQAGNPAQAGRVACLNPLSSNGEIMFKVPNTEVFVTLNIIVPPDNNNGLKNNKNESSK